MDEPLPLTPTVAASGDSNDNLPGQPAPARLHLRVQLGAPGSGSPAMGPGKADFLAAVARVGTAAGAGRALGLSYTKTRHLLDALNAAFRSPLIETVLGGREHGGARLTPLGAEVLARYREVERRAAKAAGADLARLADLARTPDPQPPSSTPPSGATASVGLTAAPEAKRRKPGRPRRVLPDQRSSV